MQPRVRAAAYENVPDIVNGPITPLAAIVINLVVGVALTAASVLLAPKPSIPDQEKRRQIRHQTRSAQAALTKRAALAVFLLSCNMEHLFQFLSGK